MASPGRCFSSKYQNCCLFDFWPLPKCQLWWVELKAQPWKSAWKWSAHHEVSQVPILKGKKVFLFFFFLDDFSLYGVLRGSYRVIFLVSHSFKRFLVSFSSPQGSILVNQYLFIEHLTMCKCDALIRGLKRVAKGCPWS